MPIVAASIVARSSSVFGFTAARHEWIFYTDGDAQYDAAEAALLGAYGLQADAIRLDYYRRLWEAPELAPG